MAHDEQLPVCKISLKSMDDKLDKLIEHSERQSVDLRRLSDEKIRQQAINKEVLRAIEDINRKTVEQDEYLDNLKFFAWLGRNFWAFTGSVLTTVGLVIAYFSIKK